MKTLVFVVLAFVGLAGCSTFGLGRLSVEGAQSGAFCVEGSGPPLTGTGHLAGAHTNDGFRGQIVITPDCGISILSD